LPGPDSIGIPPDLDPGTFQHELQLIHPLRVFMNVGDEGSARQVIPMTPLSGRTTRPGSMSGRTRAQVIAKADMAVTAVTSAWPRLFGAGFGGAFACLSGNYFDCALDETRPAFPRFQFQYTHCQVCCTAAQETERDNEGEK
jgi:hypothetical protein